MDTKTPVVVCTFELENGYIIKNFFGFNALKGRPVVSITDDKILSANLTTDSRLYGYSDLKGDEISLLWEESIPKSQHNLNLVYDASKLSIALSKIKKKDSARIAISQVRNLNEQHLFSGPGSSDDFIIFISSGPGGDSREGLKSVVATRTVPTIVTVMHPNLSVASSITVPVKQFKSMVDSFSKCKGEQLMIRFYPGPKGRTGFVITTDNNSKYGSIFEKYGEVPDDDGSKQIITPNIPLEISDLNVVKISDNGSYPVLEIQKPRLPNEYPTPADKIPHFIKLGSMHNEGNVQIIYEQGKHLKIFHRFGAFGEGHLYLHNEHCIG